MECRATVGKSVILEYINIIDLTDWTQDHVILLDVQHVLVSNEFSSIKFVR